VGEDVHFVEGQGGNVVEQDIERPLGEFDAFRRVGVQLAGGPAHEHRHARKFEIVRELSGTQCSLGEGRVEAVDEQQQRARALVAGCLP
jgi:hypothetical protein